jgi:hypothetical protein
MLLLLGPATLGLILGLRTSYVNLSPLRRRTIIALRAGVLGLVPLVLANPVYTMRSHRSATVFLVDVSNSVPDAMLEGARVFIRQVELENGSPIEVVTFGEHPRLAGRGATGPSIVRHDREGSNLASAIAFGRGIHPEGSARLVLCSRA